NMDAALEVDNISDDSQLLAASLGEMRDRFKNLSIQTEQRNWINEGLTRFADILRAHNHSLSELSDQIIRHLVKYLNANQGAFFILNDDDENDSHLELNACYAYDRRKHLNKRCEIGEGLIGQTFL